MVIAPDSFKESLGAKDVATSIARGVHEACPDAECLLVPMGDGGEGTAAAVVAGTGGEVHRVWVTGPMGVRVHASFGLIERGHTAVIEMATASGLELVSPRRRNPMQATSFGTGELIRAALDTRAERCILGVGGSATVDGGAGMLQALGGKLTDDSGREIPRGGSGLERLAHMDLSEIDPRVNRRIEVACDVDHLLLGDCGAAAVFGPQKGATPEMVEKLEAGLARLAAVIKRDTGIDVTQMPGGGAGGGIPATLVACLGATLRPGVQLVAELVGLAAKLEGADLVITGEGRIDRQSVQGKLPVGVARLAKRHGIPVIALAGSVGEGAEDVYGCGVDAVLGILSGPCSKQQAMRDTAENLRKTARAATAVWLTGRGVL